MSSADSVTAGLLVIGDEILSGRTKDVNIGATADFCTDLGIDLMEVRVVSDVTDDIVDAVNALRARYTYVFTTGGIGPTHDDITADAVAKAFGVALPINAQAREMLESRWKQTGTEVNEARLRMARMRGLSEEQALGAAAGLAANASRRDLLPDIEEINSSLRKDSNRAAADDYSYETDPAEPRQSGFSRGFLIMILIAVALVLLYTYAAQISEMVPALGGVMDSYVGAVNGLRVWLDTQILSLMGWLDGMTSQTPADS